MTETEEETIKAAKEKAAAEAEERISAAAKKEADEKAAEEKAADSNAELKIATEVSKRLNEKLAEIKGVEEKIDKKMSDFKAFVKETETHGAAKAGQEKSEAQKEKDAAMSLVEGTGLNPFAEESQDGKAK